jgi:hypothetical protein
MICCCNFLSSFSSKNTLNDCGAKLSNITTLNEVWTKLWTDERIDCNDRTRGCNTAHKSKENAYELTMGNSHTLTLCPPAGIVDTSHQFPAVGHQSLRWLLSGKSSSILSLVTHLVAVVSIWSNPETLNAVYIVYL